MKHKPNPELIDEENPEWTEEDFRRARPAREVLPEILGEERAAELLEQKSGRCEPQERPDKQLVTLRLDADVLAYFKARGKDWQAHLNETLRGHMRKRKEKS